MKEGSPVQLAMVFLNEFYRGCDEIDDGAKVRAEEALKEYDKKLLKCVRRSLVSAAANNMLEERRQAAVSDGG